MSILTYLSTLRQASADLTTLVVALGIIWTSPLLYRLLREPSTEIRQIVGNQRALNTHNHFLQNERQRDGCGLAKKHAHTLEKGLAPVE